MWPLLDGLFVSLCADSQSGIAVGGENCVRRSVRGASLASTVNGVIADVFDAISATSTHGHVLTAWPLAC